MPAQLTQRPFTFFNPNQRGTAPSRPTPADGRSASQRRLINIQVGLAELMLLNRLRARTRRDRDGDTLERAAQIMAVTSRHWFAEPAAVSDPQPSADRVARQKRPVPDELPEWPKQSAALP